MVRASMKAIIFKIEHQYQQFLNKKFRKPLDIPLKPHWKKEITIKKILLTIYLYIKIIRTITNNIG